MSSLFEHAQNRALILSAESNFSSSGLFFSFFLALLQSAESHVNQKSYPLGRRLTMLRLRLFMGKKKQIVYQTI